MIFSIFLWVHIITGFIALVVGIVPMTTKKGGQWHNRSGLVYFWAMFGVFITSAVLSWLPLFIEETGRVNWFLLVIGIFSFYMTFTGYRYTKVKDNEASLLDRVVSWTTFVCSIGMLLLAAFSFWVGATNIAIILSVFGGVCTLMVVNDLWRYGKPPTEKTAWFYGHLGRMLGSYISASTAFTVTGLAALLEAGVIPIPGLLLWLGPTVIGVPAIFILTSKYRKKFAAR